MTTEQNTDALFALIEKDLPKDIARIKSMTGVDPAKLQAEIAGTVLFHIRSLAKVLYEVRSWMFESVTQLDSGLTDVEAHVDELSSGGGTQFTSDDAAKFVKVVAGAKWMASELLKHGQTTEGTLKLKELVELATECEQIIEDGVLEDDDDDEDEGEEGEAEEVDETPEPSETTGGQH